MVAVFPAPVLVDVGAVIAMLRRPERLGCRVDDYTIIVPCYGGHGPPLYVEEGRTVVVVDAGDKSDAIRRGLEQVSTEYVVILDADTVPSQDLGRACGALRRAGADIASTVVLPMPLGGLLAGLQMVEYEIAMKIRRLSPYLTSGACIIARADALRRIMEHHSGVFDGEDIEIGLIARRLGMRVIHVDLTALTMVPRTMRGLIAQRVRWTRGFIRLAARYFRQLGPHAIYGLVAFLGLTPLKALSIDTMIAAVLPAIYLAYLAITLVASRTAALGYRLLYPLYSLLMAILTPVATLMAWLRDAVKKQGQRQSSRAETGIRYIRL